MYSPAKTTAETLTFRELISMNKQQYSATNTIFTLGGEQNPIFNIGLYTLHCRDWSYYNTRATILTS